MSNAQVVSGTALLDIGKHHLPLSGNIKVYDSLDAEIASTPSAANLFGGGLVFR